MGGRAFPSPIVSDLIFENKNTPWLIQVLHVKNSIPHLRSSVFCFEENTSHKPGKSLLGFYHFSEFLNTDITFNFSQTLLTFSLCNTIKEVTTKTSQQTFQYQGSFLSLLPFEWQSLNYKENHKWHAN